ncbi:pyruvate dehydrogenase (acetyl-transferring) E1 component subunit alpha [Aureibacter tunicatorum]|uniref:Pyruvate dehydrogenase E1 component subunit alpha n=1 Tax=Aureibacter tunicatorum TaxID=866807 RepID=A0AAE3XK94_9BACT|nr:pyruvate dehydrogenase (acetyl-transferring) E1 component subunit alpha [Aureibacter tunicatorum]MDR6237316.1 pyruvate dehydrogenase E1 component alpha subunit [Aureibacter tunicatorum]BDD06307.1 pyruvate dehydrogenase E1 component subunit alpha [Aureibacter tunicatorum]
MASDKPMTAADHAEEKFSKETYMNWYEQMLMMRRFEEKAGQLYGQQKIRGFCHLYIGQEACVAGAVSALKRGDKYLTSYRDHAQPLALGSDPKKVMAELYGKATGISKGKGGSMHIFDKENHFYGGHGIVGGQVPLGAGIAFADKYKGNDFVTVTYLGDGAVRQGAFHEALNMAMTMKLPAIFVIENNMYAMGTSVERTSNVTRLSELASAYEMPSESVDAMYPEDVHNAIEAAAERGRKGEGPTLLEFRTYRYKGHSMSDPAKYRTKEEVAEYKAKDPIDHVKAVILEKEWSTEEALKEIDKKIKADVLECVKFAEESPYPTADEIYKDVYVEKNYPFIMD